MTRERSATKWQALIVSLSLLSGIVACSAVGSPSVNPTSPTLGSQSAEASVDAVPSTPGVSPDLTPSATIHQSMPVPSPSMPVTSEDLREAVRERLRDLLGSECFGEAEVTAIDPGGDQLDSLISDARITEGWLEEGHLWVGPLEGAVAAFGGELIGVNADEAWLFEGGDEPRGERLVRTVTPAGVEVWRNGRGNLTPEAC